MDNSKRDLSNLTADILLQRHRSLLYFGGLLPYVQRTQFVAISGAIWFIPSHAPWVIASAWFVALLTTMSWIITSQRQERQRLALEEVLSRAVSRDTDGRWEELYIRARVESSSAILVFERAEPFLWLAAVAVSAYLGSTGHPLF